MIARSGTRVTSPVALMSSRVPAIAWVIGRRRCASGGGGERGGAKRQRRQKWIFHRSFLLQSLNDGNARAPAMAAC